MPTQPKALKQEATEGTELVCGLTTSVAPCYLLFLAPCQHNKILNVCNTDEEQGESGFPLPYLCPSMPSVDALFLAGRDANLTAIGSEEMNRKHELLAEGTLERGDQGWGRHGLS